MPSTFSSLLAETKLEHDFIRVQGEKKKKEINIECHEFR